MGRTRGAGRSVRAERTRAELVRAAARQFDRDGFEGASLLRISGEAQTSLGALTFHFASKAGLADEVQAQARAVVRALVAGVCARGAGPLESARLLTVGLAGLLERDERVRGAARLLRERAGQGPAWAAEWLAALRVQLELAALAGRLAARAGPGEVAALVQCLMVGVEAAVRGREGGVCPLPWARLWDLLERGIAAP
ncbi:TetR/AcrR family transcriptional regulator [Streptacidiphilus albus]|uniref:TetR/AcrR family transcriptional regulator n=1 Tax=Streptacidiphilus albus TaxID=105425 RepID=UPI00054B000B|nr:TetR/AcrR family transcriptional regulator [Streptacidiphilus albus]